MTKNPSDREASASLRPLCHRYIAHPVAIVSGGPALLLSRILSPLSVAKVVSHPPIWLDQAELTATVAASTRPRQHSTRLATAPERETAAITCAVTLASEF